MTQQKIKQKGKVFRDPIHRLIRIDPSDQFVLDLINTPAMQRLRRVRQLGVSSLTYHGAEHSRFAHSLGVFNFAQRIMDALKRRYGVDSEVGRIVAEHANVVKAAALLHDLGHGPFSHMIERASGSSFAHEEMTVRLIKDEADDWSVGKVLRRAGIDPNKVADVITQTYAPRLAVDIVSSQLDADRMDYLLRDSLMTGVEYGIYDAEWLLNAMCVATDPGGSADDSPELSWRLALDRDRGLYSAEQMILARHHMMLQVYMHKVTRGYEVLLLAVFRHVARLAEEGRLPDGTPSAIVAYFRDGIDMASDDWLLFDESSMVTALQVWSRSDDHWLAAMCQAYLQRKKVYEAFDVAGLDQRKAMDLQRGLAKAGLEENRDWGLDNGEHLPYKGVYYKAAREDGDEEQSTLSVLLGDGSPTTRGKAIESDSLILKGLDNSKQSIARLYVHLDKLNDATPTLKGLGLIQETPE